jgi:hypothetical protein
MGALSAPGLPAASPAPAATTTASTGAGGPRIQFAELAHDFGRIDAGAVAKHDFIFTNTGAAALEIAEVRPGCGCTTAGTWDKRVEPGQTGRIPLQFNSTGFSGTISKGATVTCNDTTQSNVYLTLKGTIWRPIEVTPPSAYFNISEEAPTNTTRVVRIVNNLDAPLTLSEPECTNRAFRAELKTIKPGKEFEVHLSVQPPFDASRPQATVTLKTSLTNTPVLTIPAYAYVQPAISVVPSQVMLPAGPLTAAMQPSVTIRNSGTNVLALSDASVNLEGASVTLKEVQPGRVFNLSVSVPAGLQLAAGKRVVASVKSNHPRHPVIEVPVFQSPRPAINPVTSTARPAQPAASRLPALQPPPLLARPPEPVTR